MIPNFKFLTLLLTFLCVSFYGQEAFFVKGVVKSETDDVTLAGVSVIIKNSLKGTDTDFDGNFSLLVKKGDVLVFSSLGFKDKEILFDGEETLEVFLSEETDAMEEIVVVGYGTAKKSQVTGSVSKISTEEKKLYQLPYSRADETLLGQSSGVNVQATENQAGSAPTITIRGFGSISADSRPAVVIDGVVVDYDFFANIDINDIQSFEILKDASSAAIYGSEGSNGVIMITTKSGEEGETRFSYNTYLGFREARKSDAYYFSVADHAEEEMAQSGSLSDRTSYKLALENDTDWQDIIFDGGMVNSHSFSVTGGTDKIKFNTGLRYLDDEGVILTDDYKVYGAKVKLDFNLSDKIELGMNLTPTFSIRRVPGDAIYQATRQVPWLPLYHNEHTLQFVNDTSLEVGDYAEQNHFDEYDFLGQGGNGLSISNSNQNNPGAKLLEREFYNEKFKLFSNVYGKYSFNDALNFRTSLGFTYENNENTEWQGVLATTGGAGSAYYQTQTTLNTRYIFDNYFTYENEFGRSDVNAVAGITLQRRNSEFDESIGSGYENDLIKDLTAASSTSSYGYEIERKKIGAFARVSYAYDDKYLLSASIRRDGSSVFGTDSKYGNFPAVSIGWNVANENFLRYSNFLSNFKLRFSYGITGNENFDTGNDLTGWYSYLALLQSSNAVIDGEIQTGVSNANIVNDLLQWEGSEEINPGVDFGFLNDRITGSFEWYKRTSNGLLVANPVSFTSGFSSVIENTGEVVNTGFELEIVSNNVASDKFGWQTAVTAMTNQNELTDFGSADGRISTVSTDTSSEWINLVGNPVSSFYGWVVDSEISPEYLGPFEDSQYGVVGGESQVVYVKDLNGDGIINDDDKTILGDPYPDLVWSITNDFRISNFDLAFMFQGSHGAETINVGDYHLFHHFDSDMGIPDREDFPVRYEEIPNVEFLRNKVNTSSVVQKASYIALRNVNIGYSVPYDFISRYKLEGLRIYATGQNLMFLTSDDYTGYNPEAISSDNTPTNYGYQIGGSPIFRTVSLGLNLDF